MPSSVNALLAAWAISLIILVSGMMVTELSYDPEAEAARKAAEEAAAAADVTDENPTGSENPAAIGAAVTEETADAAGPSRPQQRMGDKIIPVQPLAELLEDSAQGPLPRISAEGLSPMQAYSAAHPVDDSFPRIAIVMSELGQSARRTQRAVADLPPEVSLAFSPYGSKLNQWAVQSRAGGHEIFLMVPMEPTNYPQNDPGPLTLLAEYSVRENANLLRSSLGRMTGYVGVVNYQGSRLTAATESIRPILNEIKRRGLMFLDSRSTRYSQAASVAKGIGLPVVMNNRYIDTDLAATEIANQLAELEKRASAQGAALGMARPYPVTIDSIKLWAAGLEERGFILVPASAIVGRQPIR